MSSREMIIFRERRFHTLTCSPSGYLISLRGGKKCVLELLRSSNCEFGDFDAGYVFGVRCSVFYLANSHSKKHIIGEKEKVGGTAGRSGG